MRAAAAAARAIHTEQCLYLALEELKQNQFLLADGREMRPWPIYPIPAPQFASASFGAQHLPTSYDPKADDVGIHVIDRCSVP
jgi:hypothetical protein